MVVVLVVVVVVVVVVLLLLVEMVVVLMVVCNYVRLPKSFHLPARVDARQRYSIQTFDSFRRGFLRHIPISEPELPIRVVTKRKQLTRLRERQRMTGSRGHADDHSLGEGFENPGRVPELLAVHATTALAGVVAAPTEDLSLVGDDEIVVAAAGDVHYALRLQRGDELRDSLLLVVTELTVLVRAARVHAAVVEQEERVIEATTGAHQLLRGVVEEGQSLRAFGRRIRAADAQLAFSVSPPTKHRRSPWMTARPTPTGGRYMTVKDNRVLVCY